ncbi:hypothetical protein [Plantactinospora sp. CA-290183]|uniref:hypothetical protein n=1 Tax=Plantactinospora sp. CA-290183 TaxID=3240006 RepID=UPI003D8F1EDA
MPDLPVHGGATDEVDRPAYRPHGEPVRQRRYRWQLREAAALREQERAPRVGFPAPPPQRLDEVGLGVQHGDRQRCGRQPLGPVQHLGDEFRPGRVDQQSQLAGQLQPTPRRQLAAALPERRRPLRPALRHLRQVPGEVADVPPGAYRPEPLGEEQQCPEVVLAGVVPSHPHNVGHRRPVRNRLSRPRQVVVPNGFLLRTEAGHRLPQPQLTAPPAARRPGPPAGLRGRGAGSPIRTPDAKAPDRTQDAEEDGNPLWLPDPGTCRPAG